MIRNEFMLCNFKTKEIVINKSPAAPLHVPILIIFTLWTKAIVQEMEPYPNKGGPAGSWPFLNKTPVAAKLTVT